MGVPLWCCDPWAFLLIAGWGVCSSVEVVVEIHALGVECMWLCCNDFRPVSCQLTEQFSSA